MYTIRPASTADCSMLALLREKLQRLLERESPSLWPMTDARRQALPEFYAQCIADTRVQVLVASLPGTAAQPIIGTAIGRIETGRDVARYGLIEDVWVEPDYRGRGICRSLVSTLTDFFQAHGIQKLSVGFAHNGTAARLWQHMGFTPAVTIANGDIDTLRASLPTEA